MRIISALCLMLLLAACNPQKAGEYHLANAVAITGDGGWDYVKVDNATRRIYIAHDTQVDVVDADLIQRIGVIKGINGAHGIAIAPDAGYGFITNGKSNHVTVFDLKTLKIVKHIKAGDKPDSIVYDPSSNRVFVFNGEGNSATVIDARKTKIIKTLPLGGGPEFSVADNAGHVYVNISDTSELLQMDTHTLKVLNRWALAPCGEPSSLAMDIANQRLFAGCRNLMLTVVNARNGSVITTLPIGQQVDATAYDPQTHLVISSNGDGTMTVIHQDDADHYHVVQLVDTPRHSKTFGLDEKTHQLFVPAAQFKEADAPENGEQKPKATVVPDSFALLTFAK